jgi:error-prone DNA polymerase
MGFYQPAQLVIDAQKHGVEVLPVDVNLSGWDHLLEVGGDGPSCDAASGGGRSWDAGSGSSKPPGKGRYRPLRLGFRQIGGFKEEEAQLLVAGRAGAYTSIPQLRDAGVSQTSLERLADADAFRSLGLDRRRALWEVSALADRPIALFTGQPAETAYETPVALPDMTDSQHVVQDYAATSLSLKAHPVSFVREKLALLRVLPTGDLGNYRDGDYVKVAGLVLVRQQPGTASGVVFITIEDETSTANLVVFHDIFMAYRKVILESRLLMVEGKLQIEGEVVHVIVKHCHNFSPLLRDLVTPASRDFH